MQYELIMVLDDGETYSLLKDCKILMVPKEDLDNGDEKYVRNNGYRYSPVMSFSDRFFYVHQHSGMSVTERGTINVRLPKRTTETP